MDLKLPPEIDAALTHAARRAVEVARSQSGKPIPWAEVKRRHGLAG